MKLLKIVGGNDGGGIFECEKQFIEYWKKSNIEVHAIIIGEGKASKSYKKLVHKYIVLPSMHLVTNGFSPIKAIINIIIVKYYMMKYSSLIDQLIFEHYSAIIYQRHLYISIASHMAKKKKSDIYWHMPLAIRGYIESIYFKYMIKKHNINVIGNSKYTMVSIGDASNQYIYPGYNNNRVSSINTKPYFRKKLLISEKDLVFGMAARITNRKAIHIIIESFSKLCNKYEGVQLMIAGEPLNSEYGIKCIDLAKKVHTNVHFLGNVENMPEFYASIDVYVHSILDVEAFGISVAESLGSGLPIIAHSSGGPKEMVVHNYNGWLVDKTNTTQYYLAMQKAVLSKDELKIMGDRSKKLSINYRAENSAIKFINIINSN